MTENDKMTILKEKFAFYFFSSSQTASCSSPGDAQQKIMVGPFSTAEEFWGIYQHMKRPNVLPPNIVFCLFRENVSPSVEDVNNRNGGKFKFSLKKNDKTNKIWEDLLIMLLISDEKLRKLNGVHLQSLEKCIEISLWTSQLSDLEVSLMEEFIKDSMDDNIVFQIDYQLHLQKSPEILSRHKISDDRIDVGEDRRKDVSSNHKRLSVNETMKFQGFKDAIDNEKLRGLLEDMDSID